ncbi:MAG: TIGR03668 family PPOX class F420-dependent oxidoreductase [Acidimicrobiia bacterium]|nr:TIGR03668 family PPOX class F420-dependent oxidoreductase [Acidimicrobiia bacterium]
MQDRFAAARVARLATVRPDGGAHVVPVVFAVVGHTVYVAVDHKPKRTTDLQRIRNLRAEPRCSLLVDHYEDDWSRLWWVRADAAGRLVDDADERRRALDALAAKYPQYEGRRPEGPVLAFDVTRWSHWSA